MTLCRPLWRGIQGSVGSPHALLHRLPSEDLVDCGVHAAVRTDPFGEKVKGPAVGGARWTTRDVAGGDAGLPQRDPPGVCRIIKVNALGCCLHTGLLFQGTMGS